MTKEEEFCNEISNFALSFDFLGSSMKQDAFMKRYDANIDSMVNNFIEIMGKIGRIEIPEEERTLQIYWSLDGFYEPVESLEISLDGNDVYFTIDGNKLSLNSDIPYPFLAYDINEAFEYLKGILS